jgi:hypothetical protein
MKKSLVVFALACLSMLAFAQSLPLSVGAGINWSPIFISDKLSNGSQWLKDVYDTSAFGGAVFVDAKYIQASIGIAATSKSVTDNYTDSTGASSSNSISNGNVNTSLSIVALGKYPFELSGFSIFPLAGLEYDLNLSYKDSNGNDLKSGLDSDHKANLNAFFIKAGVGADFPVAEKFFVRPELLVGYKFHSKLESDVIDNNKTLGIDESYTFIKVDIGVSVGYKL